MTAAALRQFLRERFPLASHVPMVAVFALGNVAVALGPGGPAEPLRFAAVWALGVSYFLRLRCFDEIKDLATDLEHNPDRPLARGLVTRRDLGAVLVTAFVFEQALAALLAGPRGMLVHAAAQAFSLLMYREFFIGAWLRPRLTTYAVTHTLSAALLGASLGALYAGLDPRALDPAFALMLLFNWALFNLFEFARKSWAPDEERPGVDSYTRRFGVVGAVALSWSQVAAGLLLLALHPRAVAPWGWWAQAAAALLPLGGGLALVLRRTPAAAGLFRGLVSAYLVLFYAVLAAAHLWAALGRSDAGPA